MYTGFYIGSLLIISEIIKKWIPEITIFNQINLLWEYWLNSFNFNGLITRKKFWITQAYLLFQLIIFVILGVCLFYDASISRPQEPNFLPFVYTPIYSFLIISTIPSISLQIRRLRDAAKNPWWILISFVPFIGGIVLLIFYMSPSRKKRLPMTLQDRLSEVEDLMKKGTIDEEEYKYMRKKILTKYVN